MLSSRAVIAFVATTRPDRARAFYEQVLGLRFVADEPWALVFDAHGTMLRIQKAEAFTPHPFTALGWDVPDLEAAVRDLAKRGVIFERYGFLPQDDLGIWRTPDGTGVAWFKDPDGNTLSVSQFSATT